MIFLDASAMVAMLTGEPDANDLTNRLAGDPQRFTSPIAVFETVAAIMRKRQIDAVAARHVVERFLTIAGVTMSPVGRTECEAALQAFDRFGKGRHPAALNMGDCFAYASARALGARLLFKGNDFASTDIASA